MARGFFLVANDSTTNVEGHTESNTWYNLVSKRTLKLYSGQPRSATVRTKSFAMITTRNGRARPDTPWALIRAKRRGPLTETTHNKYIVVGNWESTKTTKDILGGVPEPGFLANALQRLILECQSAGEQQLAGHIVNKHPLARLTDPVTTVLEGRDIPRTGKQIANLLLGIVSALKKARRGDASGIRELLSEANVSDTVLGALFGVAPTVADVRRYINASEAVAQQINRIQNGDALRGTTTAGKGSPVLTGVHSKWRPGPVRGAPVGRVPSFPLTKRQLESRLRGRDLRAHDIVTGLWNIIPWSWAIDWFTNVGALLRSEALLREQEFILESVCYTQSKTWSTSQTSVKQDGGHATYGINWESKARWCGRPTRAISFSAPAISAYKVAVATALFRLKTR